MILANFVLDIEQLRVSIREIQELRRVGRPPVWLREKINFREQLINLLERRARLIKEENEILHTRNRLSSRQNSILNRIRNDLNSIEIEQVYFFNFFILFDYINFNFFIKRTKLVDF